MSARRYRTRAMNTKVVGRRVVAFIIDGLVLGATQAALFFLFAGDRQDAFGDVATGETVTTYLNLTIGDTEYAVYGGKAALYFALVLLLHVGYFVVLQGLKGVTLGKAMLGIRVVKDDGSGQPPGIGRAFGR